MADLPPPENPGPAEYQGQAADENANADTDRHFTFLYKALDDNQNVIRLLDTKAAFAVALLSAMIGKVLSDLPRYFPWGELPLWRQTLAIVFGFIASLAAVIVARILFPTSNPADNTYLLSGVTPQFYLSKLSPRNWLRFFVNSPKFSRLAQDHAEYLKQISGAGSPELLRVISAEVLKVSYIRQIKTDRFKALMYTLAASALLFGALMGAEAALPKPAQPESVRVEGAVIVGTPVPSNTDNAEAERKTLSTAHSRKSTHSPLKSKSR